ncbi:GntR family transcriptional regulator [Thermus scotoductus]|uniref:GntR family transcriptional regulator n=1 Tax=Thermus scotoductus TaxID=37636 RepID=UPI0020A49466|nr:GntR family transcriptional regulator [Thermus scotoductus]
MAHKYVEVKEALLREIRAGKLNGELPSEDALAQRFSVSRMTARRALEELAAEGWLERGRGRRSRLVELRFGQGFSAFALSTVLQRAWGPDPPRAS